MFGCGGGLLDYLHQPFDRILTVSILGSKPTGLKNQYTLCSQASPRKTTQSVADISGERG
jgi:hypothetical protein